MCPMIRIYILYVFKGDRNEIHNVLMSLLYQYKRCYAIMTVEAPSDSLPVGYCAHAASSVSLMRFRCDANGMFSASAAVRDAQVLTVTSTIC